MFSILKRMVPLAALLATTAFADPVQMKFTGVEGTAAFGYYVGPYYGQLEGQNVSLYCDDFANEVHFGQTWLANLSKITSGSDLSNTRYGGVENAIQKYQEIAWLDTQFGVQSQSAYGDIHATIWDIFDPSEAPRPSSDKWLKLAEASYRSMTFDNFRVVTNVGPVKRTGQVQEFITLVQPPAVNANLSTPEPAPGLMIAGGLILLGVAAGRLRRHAEKAAPVLIE